MRNCPYPREVENEILTRSTMTPVYEFFCGRPLILAPYLIHGWGHVTIDLLQTQHEVYCGVDVLFYCWVRLEVVRDTKQHLEDASYTMGGSYGGFRS